MTTQEFSNGFDVLLNSYIVSSKFGDSSSPNSIELNEYEKSQLLTLAQEELIVSLYKGQSVSGYSYEEVEDLRRSLDALVATYEPVRIESTGDVLSCQEMTHSYYSLLPTTWYITFESILTTDGRIIKVKPISHDQLNLISTNPYRKASLFRALRLDVRQNTVEIIHKSPISKYYIRYIKQPDPIILESLGSLSINGKSSVSECELNQIMHKPILNRAVEMAIQRASLYTRQK